MDYPRSTNEFLVNDARAFMNAVNRLDVSIDGRELDDVLGYRFSSDDVFTLDGDPTFTALDPCVTGNPQAAVVDGFFMMFKPLEAGLHTIVVHGTNTFGHDKTFTYSLTLGYAF